MYFQGLKCILLNNNLVQIYKFDHILTHKLFKNGVTGSTTSSIHDKSSFSHNFGSEKKVWKTMETTKKTMKGIALDL
jgi:hypothetical protein